MEEKGPGLQGPGFKLERIATVVSGPVREVRKPDKLDPNLPPIVIEYDWRIFEIPLEMFDYFCFIPRVLEKRMGLAIENGLEMDQIGGYGCHYCNHFTHNLANQLVAHEMRRATGEKAECFIYNAEDVPGLGVKECNYTREIPLKTAESLRNCKTGVVVMAQKHPCVAMDTKVMTLLELGLLDEYEVQGRTFDYPTTTDLHRDPLLIEKFRVDVPDASSEPDRKGFFKRFRRSRQKP